MFSLITIIISLICVSTIVEAGRNNYYANNRGNYYYRNQYPTSYNRGYNNNYYQGYRAPYQGYQRQYQGYGNNYQYQRQYQGYGNNYQNYYYPQSYAQPTPAPQPSLAQLLFGARPRQASYSSGGINYDSYGNSFVGTKENGIYLFCNGIGCPGRG